MWRERWVHRNRAYRPNASQSMSVSVACCSSCASKHSRTHRTHTTNSSYKTKQSDPKSRVILRLPKFEPEKPEGEYSDRFHPKFFRRVSFGSVSDRRRCYYRSYHSSLFSPSFQQQHSLLSMMHFLKFCPVSSTVAAASSSSSLRALASSSTVAGSIERRDWPPGCTTRNKTVS